MNTPITDTFLRFDWTPLVV